MINMCMSQMLLLESCGELYMGNLGTAWEIVSTGYGQALVTATCYGHMLPVQSGRNYRPSQAKNMQCYSNHIHSTKLIGSLWLQTGIIADCS